MHFWEDESEQAQQPSLDNVYASPGHLIRRSQQISASLFAEELGHLGLTSVQYAALVALWDQPGLDQRSLGRLVAIDRSTIGSVVKSLDERGLITRRTPEHNQRIKVLTLTEAGEQLVVAATAAVATVQRRILSPLSAREQATFLRLISKLVELNNVHSRAPLVADGEPEPS